MQADFQPNRRRFLQQSLLSLPVLSALSWSGEAQNRYGIVGQQAPDIYASHWIDGDGQVTNFSISEVDGKWVYLKCFQNWCPGCHKYGFPALQKFTKAFENESRVLPLAVQTVFEGFSTNSQDKVAELQRRYDLPIKMGHDAGQSTVAERSLTMQRYRTGGTPWVVIIDPSRRVTYNDYHLDVNKLIGFIKENLAATSNPA